jgi:hypothetical protein
MPGLWEILSAHPLFADFPQEDLDAITSGSPIRKFPDGEPIISLGSEASFSEYSLMAAWRYG